MIKILFSWNKLEFGHNTAKMSKSSYVLCTKLLEEHFGPIVSRIGKVLLEKGAASLTAICSQVSDITKTKVKVFFYSF